MKGARSERGQVLIFIILMMIAVLGIAALAVDGGRVFSERRRAQNAADAAALAAAYAATQNLSAAAVEQQALNSAVINGFANLAEEVEIPADQRTINVEYHNPPVSGMYVGNSEYYQVIISMEAEPAFSHLVYGGENRLTVTAVARARTSNSSSGGNVLHATAEEGEGVNFSGNIDLYVHGGNVYSNANGVKNGTSGIAVIEGGELLIHGSWSGSTAGLDPHPKTGVPRQSSPDLPVPDCNFSNGSKIEDKKGVSRVTPGKFTGGLSLKGDWVMEPGMYCVWGGMTINGNSTLTGSDVMIVMMSGTIKLNGNGEVHLTRKNDIKDASGNQWGGMLIYVPKTNSEEVYLSGTNDTVFAGTIYAPSSQCELGGNNVTFGMQSNLICHNFRFHGNPYFDITYDSAANYRMPAMIELVE